MSESNLLSDFVDLEFAAEVGRNPRTVRRWLDEPNGLPYTRIGNRVLIHLPTARGRVFSRMRNRKPPRRTPQKMKVGLGPPRATSTTGARVNGLKG